MSTTTGHPLGVSATIEDADRAVFKEFLAAIWASGFRETEVCDLLGIRDVPLITPQNLPSYLWRCTWDNSARALLVCLFLLRQMVRRKQAEPFLGGPAAVDLLLRLGLLLEPEPGALVSPGDLYPCLGVSVFTDSLLARKYMPDHVYQLGTDSYTLARVTPRRHFQKALDLCTGSGIHAVVAALHSEQSLGVDINPRAVEFARLNAEMNGVSQYCTFLAGDLYEPVGQQTFDLITANPPFVPTPDRSMQRHRTGGETGEEISERLVAGLPSHLKEGGTFSMVLDYPVMRNSTYLERLQIWLGGTPQGMPGWGIAVLNFGNVSREHYIRQHIREDADFTKYHNEYMEYLRSYEHWGILEVGFANVFIRRLAPDKAGWAVERMMITPHIDQSKRTGAWLDCLEKYADPAWEPDWEGWKPSLGPLVAELWRDSKKKRGVVEFVDIHWHGSPVLLDGDQTEVASWCKGRLNAERLAQRWAERNKVDLEQARASLKAILRFLAQQLLWS